MNKMINEIIANICYMGVTTVFGVASFYFKRFIESKIDVIEHQRNLLKEQLGVEQYNKNKDIAIEIINAVEQMGREFNWEGSIKHRQATQMIADKTGLNEEEIFNIIKSTVSKFNKDKKIIS